MIEYLFEVGINLIETFLITEFLLKYLDCKFSGRKMVLAFLAGWFLEFAEICIMNRITVFETYGTYIAVLIHFVFTLAFLKGSLLRKLWASVLIQIIVTAIAIGTNLGVCSAIGYDPNLMITEFNIIRVITVIITKILLFYITRIILRNRHKYPLDKNTWLMLIVIPVISIISLCFLMKAAMTSEDIKFYILVGMLGIVVADIITYYFYTVMNREYETSLKLKLLEQQNENARKNIENANAFVEQMKSVRHDIKNQLVTIYGYMDENRIEESKEYIKNLTENYLPSAQSFVETGNAAFDALMNSKTAICLQKKIFIEIKLQKDTVESFDTVDTVVIFGNLLDNAIEAAEHSTGKHITVDVRNSGRYLSILVSNSIDNSVLGENKSLETNKSDREHHGIGIKSVKAVVGKYDGMIQFFEENGEFCCHILIDPTMAKHK